MGNIELRIAEDLALPATVVTQTIGILAVKGSGKTYTALVLACGALRRDYR